MMADLEKLEEEVTAYSYEHMGAMEVILIEKELVRIRDIIERFTEDIWLRKALCFPGHHFVAYVRAWPQEAQT
jgi:hypothetical protein